MDTAAYEDVEAPASNLKLSDLLWRPWYAKAWWASTAVFWAAVAFVPAAAKTTDDGFVFALSLFLHPFALMWYMLARYLFIWRKGLAFPSIPSGMAGTADGVDVDVLLGEADFGFSRSGVMSYLDDPTDVESPLNPANPINPLHPMNRY